ncbi:hypothetical protein CcI49_11405 [Frankia sp. CcI49]|nr:hypothetical protein CcI49_11405 [Frankia sp. CcI49]
MVIDGLLMAGSILLIIWVAFLERLVDAGINGWPFALALALPLSNAVQIVALLLVLTFGRPYNTRAVVLLLFAFVALTASGIQNVHWVVAEQVVVNQATSPWIGGLVGITLLGLALVVPPRESNGRYALRDAVVSVWEHVYLPYLPFLAAVALMTVLIVRDDPIARVELGLFVALAAIVTIRQMITLLQNTRLLAKVQETQRSLRHQALHDPLTGLGNRLLFDAELAEAVDRQRDGGRSVVLLVCDLDDFKGVNDTLGHAVGDELLCAVAGRMRCAVREEDLAARLGGDEFAVLLGDSGSDPWVTGEEAARRLEDAMRPPFRIHGHDWAVGVSVGLAVADARALVGADDITRRADLAMYAVKKRRRAKAQTQAAATFVNKR